VRLEPRSMSLPQQLLQGGLQLQLARGTARNARRLLQASLAMLMQAAESQPAPAGRGPEKCESRGSQQVLPIPTTVAVAVTLAAAAAVKLAVVVAAAAAAVRVTTCLVPPQPAAAALTVIG
jgi:hypothetical protein